MTPDEYQALAARTAGTKTRNDSLVNAALGLAGEYGEFKAEVNEALYSRMYGDIDYPRDGVRKEAGDLFWYAALVCTALDLKVSVNQEKDSWEALLGQPSKWAGEELTESTLESLGTSIASLCDHVKKVVFHGHEANVSRLASIAQLVFSRVEEIATPLTGSSAEEIAEANIAKLKARYPDGFSHEKSINRTC